MDQALVQNWDNALASESYEETSTTLQELRELRKWRSTAASSRFKDFYGLFEQASMLGKNKAPLEEQEALRDELLGRLSAKAHSQSPRVADLWLGILSELDGIPYTPEFETTAEKIKSLKESGDLQVLLSPDVPFDAKLNRFKTRLEGELLGRRALDKRDRALEEKPTEEESTSESGPQTPPPAQDQSKPGMDEMQRSPEGEMAPAIWSIKPAWGGYYKSQSFDTWDPAANTWRQKTYEYTAVTDLGPGGSDVEIQMEAQVFPGQWTRLDLPYTHRLTGLISERSRMEVRRDQNGDHVFRVNSDSQSPVTVVAYAALLDEARVLTQEEEPAVPGFTGGFSAETQASIEAIARRKQGNLPRARALSRLVMQRLKYSNDSSFNAVYDSHPGGYIAAIDEHRQADCDVGNTYFAALCAQLHIPVRHVVGHMVKGKDGEGNSRITSGTGHAWSEVWNDIGREWVRIDATPPGDPQLEQEEKQKGESAPGDYGSQEEVGPTDEQLRELEEKLANLTEQLQYSPEERQLAEATGIEMKEARDIVKEIAAAEETRLPNGERVVDVLSQLFTLLIETRKAQYADYTGPVRQREGGLEIEDIVTHYVGTQTNELDPVSRRLPHERTDEEKIFGGFDVYMIGDKSGSMANTVEGEPKWQMQRRAEYLILSALHRFEQNLQRIGTHMNSPLSVRTEAISFRDDDEIDVDKPLTAGFEAEDKVRLWRSLTTQGSGNGDSAALAHIYNQIEAEDDDTRLRLIIACTDGYPDDVAKVHQYAEALGKRNATVVGTGLTETAQMVEQIYTTEFSKGVVVRDLNDLPAVVGKHLVLEALKLFPERGRKMAERQIGTILSKFGQVL